MRALLGLERRGLLSALGLGVPAARGKATAGGWVGQVRGHPGDAVEALPTVSVEVGYRVEERLSIGVPDLIEQRPGVGALDDLARVHDDHPVGPIGDHTNVVANRKQAILSREMRPSSKPRI